jgi:uncharacterized protein YaaN involved in tellurite resistance
MNTSPKVAEVETSATTLPVAVSSGNLPSVAGAMEIQTPEAIKPMKPKHVTAAADRKIRADALEVAKAILENPSDVKLTATIYGLGADAETANSSNISLVDQKIGPLMKEISTDSMLGKNLTQIKAQLDLVNPHIVGQTPAEFTTEVKKWGLLGKRLVNEVVSRLPLGSTEVMTIINGRSDTIRQTVDTLKGHLWTERDKALKNALELGQMANHLADMQDDLQEAAYQGQLIWEELSRHLATETDLVRKQSLTYLVNDLATKVIDLQMVDQLNTQSRMGAETLINNCRGIQTLVNRVTNTLLPSVMNALAAKAAGAQQAQLVAAARGIGAAAGDTIAATAKDIGNTSVAIAKMNTEGMVDIAKLEEAQASYEEMQQQLDMVIAQAEQNARGLSNRLAVLNARSRDRVDPLAAARQAKEAAGV